MLRQLTDERMHPMKGKTSKDGWHGAPSVACRRFCRGGNVKQRKGYSNRRSLMARGTKKKERE